MASEPDMAAYAAATAQAIGLPIAAEDLPAVVAVLSNIARVAAPLMAFPLPEEAELAPVFEPDRSRR